MRTSNVTSSVSERRMATTGKAFRKLLVFKKYYNSRVFVCLCVRYLCVPSIYVFLSLSLNVAVENIATNLRHLRAHKV